MFLKYGVTTVRDLHSDADVIFPMAREDSVARPRIVTSGPLIDGGGSFWKNAVQVRTVGEARAAVRQQIEQGARVIKVYTRLDPALVSVDRRRGPRAERPRGGAPGQDDGHRRPPTRG